MDNITKSGKFFHIKSKKVRKYVFPQKYFCLYLKFFPHILSDLMRKHNLSHFSETATKRRLGNNVSFNWIFLHKTHSYRYSCHTSFFL